ncbi:MAG: hypothetical protein DI551_09685 [Micavibrio aeruginosavorus]|uniref:Uncharacterized protein n=1 Tax=Micavibrio aeruginosavorus TaxID=349221 RepID=A0A2W5MTT4_9BACT|nr:MAG: hypothetical protein DI551_09685 [Micavibrio aeruginosavorus]
MNDHIQSLNEPISESGRVAFDVASKWGGSIPPRMAEAIAKAVREHAGVPEDTSEKKSVLGYSVPTLK